MSKPRQRGFLPFDTNPFDRIFVSVLVGVAWHLLFVRFLESPSLSIWYAFAAWIAVLVLFVWKG